uniref:Band 7 domain-containing protein n=1 Tax=Timema douglasi TaxID=61478 RepID=A0A7R8VF77_TIMDO|nr:unnamed protein product [Timema douglasi]
MDFDCIRTESGGLECAIEFPEPEPMGCVEIIATLGSILILIFTFPFSLCFSFKVLTKDSVTVTVDAVVYYRVNEPLGAIVKVNNYSKDVRLPVQLQRAMAAEAEAAREARAKVIAAEGEMKASRALKEAADVIGESPAALQLRYLQTLNTISAEKNSTIIFPLPMDMITPFLGIPRKT